MPADWSGRGRRGQRGILVGILTSLPDAIITKAYAPIVITGVLFGAIAGWIVGRWGLALT